MKLTNPLDMHLHFRDEAMLEFVAPFSAKEFKAGVIMPNLVPPLTEPSALKAYKQRVLNACKQEDFTPLMTLFYKGYDKTFLENLRDEIFAIKLYPAGITTNSDGGVSAFDIDELKPTLEAMSELEIPLLVHGETNDFVMDREARFAPIYEKLALHFPKLKIVMEHITTKVLCELVQSFDNLYATITLHHLLLTLDDVIGGKMQPHLFCKPIAKRKEDKEALCKLAFSGFEKVMFGSDSAPHPQHEKECCGCAAGVFSAPVIISVLAELFTKHSNLNNLQKFISDNACKAHKLSFKKDKIITLEQKQWQVPSVYASKDKSLKVVPFMAGQTLQYQAKLED
ncbi:dihydroorotase [Campylobacter sp. MIT 12-5580]|uniref:dihydroorotase n=1 Tax=Campylobacter sp. MIT 12-5580 TaxID=2040651 RepID=UPI0010F7FD65|nr:dihydroorotase [Campylobacter sp. MIT 12-5580]TKX29780.1 dihydroorotase [Campylobacter sp. MIT 12-5580]